MKITIDRNDFANAVQFVSRMSPKRPKQPILGGVLLTTGDGEVKLTVYDYEIAAETSIIADITTEGAALVHAPTLALLVAKLPQKPVTLEAAETALKLTCGSVKASLPLMPAGEYPTPDLAHEAVASLSGAVFEDAIQRVAPSASNDDSTPIIMGVHIVADDAGVLFEATDRFRVAHMPVACETTTAADLILSAVVLREAAKALGSSESVEIGVTESGAVTVSGERGTILARIISGNYPPVARLFPKEPTAIARVDREVMSEATGRAALAIESQAPVRYRFTEGECSVAGASSEDGNAVSEEFEVEHDAAYGEVVVSLKPQFVIDGLTACRAGRVEMWFTHGPSDGKPGPVMFAGDAGFRYLLQPNLLLK